MPAETDWLDNGLMKYHLRFWAEFITPPDIAKNAVELLSEFEAGVAAAMYPVSLTRKNANAFRKLRQAGVELTFWPLMEQEQGYFPGEGNITEYSAMVRHMVEWSRKNEVVPDMLAVDLEPPLQQMHEVTGASTRLSKLKGVYDAMRDNLDRERYFKAKADLDELNHWIQDRGIRTVAAVMPWVGLELEGEHELIQDMSETPVAGIAWDVISPMLYVTMIEGMAGGAMNSRDANWFVYDSCLKLQEKYAGRAGVSLGLTGAGVLEDEPTFGRPEELLVGVQAALAAGVRDVSIYSLEGLLSRRNPRAWFIALRSAKPKVPEKSLKVARSLSAARYIYPPVAKLVDWYRRPP